jgi:hypothetical protein
MADRVANFAEASLKSIDARTEPSPHQGAFPITDGECAGEAEAEAEPPPHIRRRSRDPEDCISPVVPKGSVGSSDISVPLKRRVED